MSVGMSAPTHNHTGCHQLKEQRASDVAETCPTGHYVDRNVLSSIQNTCGQSTVPRAEYLTSYWQ